MYDVDFPEYLNFGNLGSIVAHEFVVSKKQVETFCTKTNQNVDTRKQHGLDNVGKRFNGTGHLHDWWTPQATKEYEERQQCFIDEYSTVSIAGEGGKNVYVDGKVSLFLQLVLSLLRLQRTCIDLVFSFFRVSERVVLSVIARLSVITSRVCRLVS